MLPLFLFLQTQARRNKKRTPRSVRMCLCEKRAKRHRLGSRSAGVAAVGRGVDVATGDDGVDNKVHRRIGE